MNDFMGISVISLNKFSMTKSGKDTNQRADTAVARATVPMGRNEKRHP
jgi:hypothetical protein